MARYILIDSNTGYIFADSADLNGGIFTGTPLEVAKAHDECVGAFDRTYQAYSRQPEGADGYHVYRADVFGSDAVPTVWDGKDQETIESVIRDCQQVGFIAIAEAAR